MEFAATPVAKPVDEDLSAEIAKSIARQPADIVRCARVTGTRYRCNWWCAEAAGQYDNPGMRAGQIGTTHRIRQSQFLDVVRTAEGLRMKVIPDRR